MKSLNLSVLAAAVSLAFVATSTAQPASTTVLNSLDVRQLVARAEPADQTRLAAHFNSLADQYTAEATRHGHMPRTFAGTSKAQMGAGMALHCRQLTKLDSEAADTLRELANYHTQLAVGGTATAPAKSAGFEVGEGSPQPTAVDVRTWVDQAGTSTEHLVLAEYFRNIADEAAVTEATHAFMGNSFRGTRLETSAVHCNRLVRAARQRATNARTAAALQARLAGTSR